MFLFLDSSPELRGVLLLLTAVGIGAAIWGLVDAYGRPEWAWYRSAQNRGLCLSLMAGGLVLYAPLGALAALWYVITVRPRIAAAEQAGPPPFPYGVRADELPPPVPGTGHVPPPPPDDPRPW